MWSAALTRSPRCSFDKPASKAAAFLSTTAGLAFTGKRRPLRRGGSERDPTAPCPNLSPATRVTNPGSVAAELCERLGRARVGELRPAVARETLNQSLMTEAADLAGQTKGGRR